VLMDCLNGDYFGSFSLDSSLANYTHLYAIVVTIDGSYLLAWNC
jgi:hypothetical protein